MCARLGTSRRLCACDAHSNRQLTCIACTNKCKCDHSLDHIAQDINVYHSTVHHRKLKFDTASGGTNSAVGSARGVGDGGGFTEAGVTQRCIPWVPKPAL